MYRAVLTHIYTSY